MVKRLTQVEIRWIAQILHADYPHPLKKVREGNNHYTPIGEPILFVRKPYPHHFFTKVDQVDKLRYAVGEFATDRNLSIDDVVGCSYLEKEETELLSRALETKGEGVQFYAKSSAIEEIMQRYQPSTKRVYER